MATLSHDMTLDILRCLSVNDLLRFKCVSKFWCSWIEDPYFIKLHLSYSLKTNTNRSLIVRYCKYQFLSVNYDSPKTTRSLKQPLSEQKKYIQILGSCNGLLAVEDDDGRILLWNPSTRKYQVLPSTEIEFPSPPIRCSPSTYYGFGYDPISDDYKLIRMVQSHGNNDEYFHSEAKVYSLRSNCWRRIKDVCFYLKFSREFGFLANNALHWMVFKTPQSRNKELVGFDLGSEEFRFLELPECRLDKLLWFHINAVGGDICLTSTYRETDNVVVDVWIMKEYGVKQSWFKLISWKEPHFMPWSTVALPLALSKGGGEVLFFIEYKWFNRGRRIDSFVWYDLRSQEVKNVVIRDIPTSFEVNWYVDSLVPLNSNA
ncbi:hypothetical protein Gohar_006149 [Gossypium harknessii]|uniref:F-box domain-containing protein n=1 Tax=Gossypium harknessii TaxID=34285 RepID=A0A7J9GCG9_9ROSI|nr:hypothetical protein [Gossypium harknessii]